jgi:hypothetical protein
VTFEEFYPEYLAAHRDRRTKMVHAAGLLSGLAVGLAGIALRKPAWLLGGLALGYLPAFASHWVFEKNQPKTLEHPGLSFCGDFVMVYQLLTGRLQEPKG